MAREKITNIELDKLSIEERLKVAEELIMSITSANENRDSYWKVDAGEDLMSYGRKLLQEKGSPLILEEDPQFHKRVTITTDDGHKFEVRASVAGEIALNKILNDFEVYKGIIMRNMVSNHEFKDDTAKKRHYVYGNEEAISFLRSLVE